MCFVKPRVTVYGKPNCTQCDMSVKVLDREGVSFEYIDMEADPAALAFVKDLGYLQAPVVIARYPSGAEEHWAGFRPDRIKDYASAVARE